MRKLLLCFMAVLLYSGVMSQSRTVTGKVTSDGGQPIPFVTVRVVNTNAATVTDEQGDFSIPVSENARNLEFSAVGYVSQTVTVPVSTAANVESTVVNVTLQQGTSTLNEVVITGYSARRKEDFTGASSKVVAADIQQIPIASFEQILQGRAPGLYVASGSGQPGTSARVNIRGVSSISGGNDPLYILDGVPIEAGVFRSMNPNDFESVDVLKDAAGTSIYGSRGANGVIVITSRRGRSGATRIQYRNLFGFAQPPVQKNIRLQNTEERLRYEEEILGPGGVIPSSGNSGYPGWDYSPNNPIYATLTDAQRATRAGLLDSVRQINTNWADILFRDRAAFKQHEVSASGGSQNLSFFTSLSYYDQEGIVLRSGLERYTFRANIDFRTDRLNVSVRSSAGWSSQNLIESEAGIALANPIAAAYLELPYRRPFDGAGNALVGAGRTGANAYDRLFTTTATNNEFKGNLGVTLQYDIWNGISFRTINGVDWRNNNVSRFVDPNSFAGRNVAQAPPGLPGQGSYGEGNGEDLSLISTTGLVYVKNINDKHDITASAFMELIRNRSRAFSFTGYGINPRLLNTPAGISAGSPTNNLIPTAGGVFLPGNFRTLNGLFSTFLTTDYTYDRRYTVSASIRRDVPSQVPLRNRENIFWAVGASWNAIRESFMEDQNLFQDLRVRGSWGETGNANGFNSDFGYIATYGQLGAGYAGVAAIVPTSPGNEDYRLESQVMKNLGVDLTMLDNRLNATFEYYVKDTRNLFVDQGLSRTTGFNNLSTNAAEMRNQGFEFQVEYDVIRKQDLTVSFGINGATLKNEIRSLGLLTEIPQGTGIIRVGLPLGSHFAVGWVGVDPETGNPIYQDIDGNPTSVYSAANNRAAFGTFLPSFTGGANMDVRFKGFDFSIFFATAQGVQRFNNESFFYETTNSNVGFNKRIEMLTETWTTPRQVTNYQRIGTQRQFSSKDIQDASFVRLRNLQVGYTFTPSPNGRIPIKGFRVWAQGQNLATWTKWQGFDPEESNNIATYEFPNPRTFTVGLDVNF